MLYYRKRWGFKLSTKGIIPLKGCLSILRKAQLDSRSLARVSVDVDTTYKLTEDVLVLLEILIVESAPMRDRTINQGLNVLP